MSGATVSVLVVLGLLAAPDSSQDPATRITVTTVAPGLHLLSGYGNGNILAIEGWTEVILVDAQTDRRVAEADAALRTVTRKRVRQVIYTHYHEDHVSGMPHWRRGGATAVAHATVPVQMAKDTVIKEVDGWHRTPASRAARPDLTFVDRLDLALDGRRIEVFHVPGAHTDGDVVVWLPWANLLHVGDLVEPGAAPFIDWWAGGSLDGMIAAADWILELTNDSTRIIPGHGRLIDRLTVLEHRRVLAAIGERVAGGIRSGLSREQVLAARPAAGFEAFLGGPDRANGFVRLVHFGLARNP